MAVTRKTLRMNTNNSYSVSYEQIAYKGLGDIRDISVTGMKIQTLDKIEPGAIKIQFKLPSFENKQTVHGTVVWVNENKFTSGINFHVIDEQLEKSIQQYLIKKISSF